MNFWYDKYNNANHPDIRTIVDVNLYREKESCLCLHYVPYIGARARARAKFGLVHLASYSSLY